MSEGLPLRWVARRGYRLGKEIHYDARDGSY
jgi:hypothetical protein